MLNQQPETLSNLVMEYIAKHKNLKWATRDMTERVFRFLIACLGDLHPGDMGYCQAEDFRAHLAGRILPVSVNSYIKMASPVFSWAQRRGYVPSNPFVDVKRLRTQELEIRVYDQAELRAMFEAANKLWQARMLAAATAGLRRTEILNLTVDDVDFEKELVYVQAKKETENTWRWTTKDYERRTLPLVPRLADLLSCLLAELPVGQPYLMLTEKRYWSLQQMRSRGEMSERLHVRPDENFTKPFNKIVRNAGVKKGTFNDLRKTCLTRWSYHLPIQEVQRLAGHSDIKTTMVYLGIRTDIIDRARTIGATGLEPATS